MEKYDVIIIGAGAAGLMCGIEAGKRGRNVLILDHSNKAGKKILMSGGGRCNFTNMSIESENFISSNHHFCKSALSRYTQWDFINMVQQHNIAYHERDHGQLFCDNSSKDILKMLLDEAEKYNIQIKLNITIDLIKRTASPFSIVTNIHAYQCHSLVIATGGLSIPKMGATPFGYKLAEKFNHNIVETTAALVPLTLKETDKIKFESLSGIAIDSTVKVDNVRFRENLLFTHRGLSGPVILQISSYWQPTKEVIINLLPDSDIKKTISTAIDQSSNKILKSLLSTLLPKRLVISFFESNLLETKLASLSSKQIEYISLQLHQWTISPNGTEGYRTAEVTKGGVDCNQLSSKTMQSNQYENLYFIGEVVDVTGWLGGYNFQWAWSSGWCAGQYV